MNRSKKNLRPILWLTAIAFVILIGGMAHAADQTVVLNPSTANFSQGDNVDITLNYNCAEKVDTFSVVICYDSTKLTLLDPPVAYLLTGDPNDPIEAYDDTVDNNDGDAATDKYISLLYMGTNFQANWPVEDVPLNVITIHFQVNAGVADGTTTKINVVDKAEIGTFTGTGSEITVGTGVVITPMDIPTAVLAMQATDPVTTVVDANTADYANQHIAGAVTEAPADKDANILVYGSNVASAQALATDLANQGYTKVAYLNVPFADFAADTTNVTDAMVQYKLTVTTVGTGAVTGNSADGFHNRNAAVTLVADPAADVTWSANAPDGVVTMDAAKTVTATFAGGVNTAPVANAANFTVAVGGQVSGTLTGTDNEGDALTFSVVTSPAQGTLVLNADGTFTYDNPTTAGEVTFTFKVNDGTEDSATATVTITVTGTTYALTLNVDPAAGGTAAAATAGPYAAGTVVNITATPADGYKFVNWTGDAVANATVAATTVTMDADKTVTANFELIQTDCAAIFTITPNPGTVGVSVTFNASASTSSSGNIISYAWAFTDPSGANAGNPGGVTTSKPFTQVGTYTATLTITDDQGCSDTSSQTFVVNSESVIPDGDGNGDGYVDIYDALAAAMYAAEMIEEGDIARFAHLDVENTGNGVDTNDALAIAKYDVGLPCTCTLDK